MMDTKGKRQLAILLIVVGGLLLFLIVASIVKSRDGEQPQQKQGSVMTEIPDAEITDVDDSKSDAITRGKSSRESPMEAYYDSCMVATENARDKVEDPMESIGGQPKSGKNEQTLRSSDELFGPSPQRSSPPPDKTGSYRESTQEREARHQRRREEAIDMANELSGRKAAVQELEEATAEVERIDLSPQESAANRQSGVISSLSGTGSGVSSLENPSGIHSASSDHPFKCVFPRQEKVKSGQKVSVRLLEDMLVSGYVIPKNTHLQAYVTVDQRLEMEISSIEVSGQILPLSCVAYDTDGMKGIYCPEAGEAKKTVRSSGLGTIGSVLGGRMGRVAGEIVNTGVSIAQSSSGERTVTVPAGYSFFIVRKKQQ